MRTKQKILQLSKEKLGFISLAIFFNILLAGSVCGTFAWYTYATRTGFDKQYHGVTIGDTGELEVGVLSLIELPNYIDYNLTEDKTTLADENKIIYWCENIIEPTTLNYILYNNGSATNTMIPVTTGSNDILNPDDFHLFEAPKPLHDYSLDNSSYADSNNYVYLPLVFRFKDFDDDLNEYYVSEKEIYFTKCDVETSQDSPGKEVYKAIRLFAHNEANGFIINPTAGENGNDSVGGILDLNNDGFYDYDSSGYEHVYGESESFAFNSVVTQNDGTLPSNERTTFVANHKKGKFALNEETYIPKVVSYNCMKSFSNKSEPITVTDENYHNLAVLDLYVYAEGWDLHIIDEEDGSGFNMELKFEVSI